MGIVRIADTVQKDIESYRRKLKATLNLDVLPSVSTTTELMIQRNPHIVVVTRKRGLKKISDLL